MHENNSFTLFSAVCSGLEECPAHRRTSLRVCSINELSFLISFDSHYFLLGTSTVHPLDYKSGAYQYTELWVKFLSNSNYEGVVVWLFENRSWNLPPEFIKITFSSFQVSSFLVTPQHFLMAFGIGMKVTSCKKFPNPQFLLQNPQYIIFLLCVS